jgi:hypothetical protein
MTTFLYGASDDLIEIEGDITEELYPNANEWTYVGFSNGLLAKIQYNGDWIIRVVHAPKNVEYDLVTQDLADEATQENFNDYTDVLHISTKIDWVVTGEAAHG